ncbi:MAG: DUF72 domain-containing protein [Gammaproteobacteria bacterium]
MKATQGRIHIGTSGWSYDHWTGPFYPETLPADHALEYYAVHFNSVEINSSFYRLPEVTTVQHWYASTPDNFVFTAKASRYITHMKKLQDPEKSVPAFLDRISLLGDKLGPILFQLPPNWHFNAARLEAFLDSLDPGFRYAFEFRGHDWLNPETLTLLERHKAAFCIYELEGFRTPEHVTADFIYVRLHGPEGAYQGSYSHRTLTTRAEQFMTWARSGKTVYCYFDNDQSGYAANNAQQLQAILSRQ